MLSLFEATIDYQEISRSVSNTYSTIILFIIIELSQVSRIRERNTVVSFLDQKNSNPSVAAGHLLSTRNVFNIHP